MKEEGLDVIVCEKLGLKVKNSPELKPWNEFL